MGGSAVAQKLAARGQDVLLVEAGGIEKRTAEAESILAEDTGWLFGMPLTRCIELGGTSNQWHGMCAPLDEWDFEPRPWIEGSGWPIRRADLISFYGEAARMLGIPGTSYFEAATMESHFREHLSNIAFDSSVVDNKLFLFRKSPRRWKDMLLELVHAGKLRCIINAPALELIVAAGGAAIDRLIVGAGLGTIAIRAEVFVICAGALETPRLLLNSRGRLPAGVGNTHDLVGRYLLDHPAGHFCKLGFHRPTQAPIYAGLALDREVNIVAGLQLSKEQQRQHELPNHLVWIRPSVSPARIDDTLRVSFLATRRARDLTFRQIKTILTNRDLLYRILLTRFGICPTYYYGDVVFMTEQLPNRDSCVQLSDRQRDGYGYPVAQIDWQLTDADFRGFEAYTKLLFARGLRSQQYRLARIDALPVWHRTLTSAAHHLGTARMADFPRHGVVDRHLQVFGMANLFICDGSVFPTAGSANPGLTITALGCRLAEHLMTHP